MRAALIRVLAFKELPHQEDLAAMLLESINSLRPY
jgi:hypothetical protein